MFAVASSFFARTAISQSYNFTAASSASRSSTPGPNVTPSPAPVASISVGLWRVQPATHKVTHKNVSVWSFDKRGQDMERLGPAARDRTIEVLKGEASALSRLRHPSILEMVEPLEDARNELIFATEPILSSLERAISGSAKYSASVELDEVEIQKGILQICKGLTFLHGSAQLIHSNISPESILINAAGDWKISGLGLTIPLLSQAGTPTRWEFPTFDGRVPPYIQRSFDYMAPEYALDESLVTASDMYSLGCTIYAVHAKGSPPYKTHGSLGGLREHAGKPIPGMERWDPDLQALLRVLITRHALNRPSPSTLPSQSFFSSLPISTLNFLDRSNFTSKTQEEKISFMKGLTNVLDRFSEGLRTRKILPSLLEEMKDSHLLPHILPNVFSIAKSLSSQQFALLVLPSLRPLFGIKEPPQNMLTLLDNLIMLQTKTEKQAFREQVLPLVYNALDSEHAVITDPFKVQEKALRVVPGLCETIDYAEVQGTLFPRVASVFTKTRILTVKVATLETFLVMVKTLDQSTLTQKLVPLLSKIRTKEPAVIMATLSVQESMGFKVDREAVATLVLPQLWAMSIGPLLNVEQFKRFMAVIKKLGERVEKEHDQFLRDSQRLEDHSGTATSSSKVQSFSHSVDFESLVSRANGTPGTSTLTVDDPLSWEGDVWGDMTPSKPSKIGIPAAKPPLNQPSHSPISLQPSFHPRVLQANTSSTPSFTLAPQGQINRPTIPLIPSPALLSQPVLPPPVTMTNLLTPHAKPLQPQKYQQPSKVDWGEFDPLA
ncbi:kinase-like protein [Pluteus cervinus]|uniref:Kinase-like protein n=1 Tax=Pluteus cervinus TaxID=181527 RepID=A0ACD3AQA3_9AGAR|nr:kinase-like protein [Pluteus cervinus]